jgi:hypothetical protein
VVGNVVDDVVATDDEVVATDDDVVATELDVEDDVDVPLSSFVSTYTANPLRSATSTTRAATRKG